MTVQPIPIIKVFYGYAHEDDILQAELAAHLSPLRRSRYITAWFDRDIPAGTAWEQEIETQLDAANIILLLISADFFASDYWYNIAMRRALERHKAGTAHVIPIILRPVHWEDTPIGTLPVLPIRKKAVTQWANRDEAWQNVAQGIREVVRGLLSTQILSPHESDILSPMQSSQSGQPPVVLSPPVYSPRETRVLPPTRPGQSGQPTAPVVLPSPIPSHPPHSSAPLLSKKNLYFTGLTIVTICILVIISIHVIPLVGIHGKISGETSTSTPRSATQSTLTVTARPTIPATATPPQQLPNTTTVSRLVKKWVFPSQISPESVSLPAAANNIVYVNSLDGHLYALDETTGMEKWAFPPQGDLTDQVVFYSTLLPPTVANDIVYIISGAGQRSNLYAIDARTGAKKWAFGNVEFHSLPIVANGVLYINSSFSILYALDAATGTKKWMFQTGDLGNFSPTVVNNFVYTDSNDGKLVALDAATGTKKWMFPLGTHISFPQVSSWPTESSGVVFALAITGNDSSSLYAIDATTGIQKWPSQMINGLVASLTVVNGGIYIGLHNDPGSSNGHLIAFDTATGALKWPVKTLTVLIPAILVANNIVYINSGDRGGNLYAFDATTGQQKWFVEYTSLDFEVVNGVVYVGSTTDNNFDALDATTGGEKWHFQMVDVSFASPIVANGVIYVTAPSTLAPETAGSMPYFALYAFALS